MVLVAAALLGVGSSPAPASAQEGVPERTGDGGNAPIIPGDVVRLMVWRHEDLSDDFEVNQYGTVVIPRLGEIDVSGETHRSLRDRVIRELQETLVSQSIELVVLKRVRVLGEVNEPGLYLMDPTMTVADALAMASGTTPQAKQGIVTLRRGPEVMEADLRVDALLSDTPIRSGDELFVPREAWLRRNATAVLSSVIGVAGLVVALMASGGG